MKNRLIGSLVSLLTAAGLGLAQKPADPPIPITSTPTRDSVDAAPYGGPSFDTSNAPATRVWFSAEHLLWRIKDHPLPTPLASIAQPPFDTANPGAVGDPLTSIVLGGEDVEAGQWRHGGRFT